MTGVMEFAMKRTSVLLGVVLTISALDSFSADWPCYRADAARSAKSAETLAFPLEPHWVYQAAQVSQPAWPDPVFEQNQMDFDSVFEPVAAGGLVLFGSSADDCVRALDLGTGALKWCFVTGGPVRFAPAIFEGAAYVVSDDGWLTCIDLATGAWKWKHRGGPSNRRFLGAGRMISRWPLRSGALVDSGVVYFAAGMWPSEGVFVIALDARTGEEIWVNDTSGCEYRDQPHAPAAAMSGVAPQGYLAASDRFLLVPTGRAVPAVYDRKDGALIHYRHADSRLWGGAWIAVDKEESLFLTGQGDRAIQLDLATGGRRDKAFKSQDFSRVAPPRQIRTGNVTIQGLDGAVAACNAENKEIWRRPVEGEARGLAIAGGNLIVSTSAGHIHCFAPGKSAATAVVTADQPAGLNESSAGTEADGILSLISRHGITKGYALLVGAPDGRLAARLAAISSLHVVVVPNKSSLVSGIREFLLDHTALHGSRVSVIGPESLAPGELPPYFANMIVLAGMVDPVAQKNLYSLLRPCGGVMTMPGLSTDERDTLLRAASVPAGEIQTVNGSTLVVRGKLEGAFDWNSKVTSDQRVKWPLELSWFGPPGPAMVVDRHMMSDSVPIPVAANGRIFQLGANHLLAVDAYNGTLLWKRELLYAVAPPHHMIVQGLTANDQSVFLDFGKVAYQLDAQTGVQQKVFGVFKIPERFSLAAPQRFEIKCAPDSPGQIELENTSEGLKVTMTVEKAEFMPFEGWELFFDFRPAGRRMNLYEPGVYMCAIQSSTAQLRPEMRVAKDASYSEHIVATYGFRGGDDFMGLPTSFGPVRPDVRIEPHRSKTRTAIVLTMSWEEIRKMAGFEPGEFAFGARLIHAAPGISGIGEGTRLSRGEAPGGGKKITTWRQSDLFCDRYAGAINNGWAVFDIPGIPVQAQSGGAFPPVLSRADLPEVALREGRIPPRLGESPIKLRFSQSLRWGLKPSRPAEQEDGELPISERTHPHPLTGTEIPVSYNRTYGCGDVVSSATMDFFRSATLAHYCYQDNSGMRNFGGVKTSCGKPGNIIPAFGMFIAIEGSSGCNCAYNFQTSLALAPAQQQSNEDWAVYHDRMSGRRARRGKVVEPSPGAAIHQYHANLGAPGDRRDGAGKLWLGYPRVASYLQPRTLAMPIPVDVNGGATFKLYRFNVDRRAIHKTDRPWLYGTGYHDVRTVDLSLGYFNPYGEAMILSCAPPPTVDGVLGDACWNGSHAVLLPGQNAAALLRYDSENLYIAYDRRSHFAGGDSITNAVKADLHGRDVPVWEDDCMELYFGDEKSSGRMLHFAVSAGGDRYDGILPEFGSEAEDTAWNPEWASSARVTGNSFTVETAIPWEVLESTGLTRDSMTINFRQRECMTGKKGAPSPSDLSHHVKLVDSEPENRIFTVRLHFAEVDDTKPGERVFDVAIQGRTVIKDLDIRAEAGAPDTALVKEVKGIQAGRSIRVAFSPADGATGTKAVPLLSAIEAVEEE